MINIGSIVFVVRCVPETRGRTLEELEDEFRANSGKVVHRPAPAAAIHAS